jgi:succinate dehydrogenase/fumarate reductase flavoprotein subunit
MWNGTNILHDGWMDGWMMLTNDINDTSYYYYYDTLKQSKQRIINTAVHHPASRQQHVVVWCKMMELLPSTVEYVE